MSECAICEAKSNLIELKCKHDICTNCLPKINKCPLCKTNIDSLIILEKEYEDFLRIQEEKKNNLITNLKSKLNEITTQIEELEKEKGDIETRLDKYIGNKSTSTNVANNNNNNNNNNEDGITLKML